MLYCHRAVLADAKCEPLSADRAARVAEYMHDRLDFFQAVTLEVYGIEAIGDTCFKRVQLRPREQDKGLKILVYVSPDNRFVSRELFDTAVNPMEQRRKAQEELRRRLTEGRVPSKGPIAAKTSVVMFLDFQCPYCKQALDVLNTAVGADQDKVRIMFRHMPLPGHQWARQAAEMAACAYVQSDEAFWRFHDWIFRYQVDITSDNLSQKAMSILHGRVDMGEYERCVAAHQEAARIDDDIALATQLRIRVTPTLFINGQRKEGVPEASEIRDLIRQYSGSLDLENDSAGGKRD